MLFRLLLALMVAILLLVPRLRCCGLCLRPERLGLPVEVDPKLRFDGVKLAVECSLPLTFAVMSRSLGVEAFVMSRRLRVLT